MNTIETLAALREKLPDVHRIAYVVGRWVWIEFPNVPALEVREGIKSLGFRFNAKRKLWQASCGWESHGAPYDPRGKYGVVQATDIEEKARVA